MGQDITNIIEKFSAGVSQGQAAFSSMIMVVLWCEHQLLLRIFKDMSCPFLA